MHEVHRIKADFGAGGLVISVLDAAVDIAQRYDCPVDFVCNGIEFTVNAGYSSGCAYDEYQSAIKAGKKKVELL